MKNNSWKYPFGTFSDKMFDKNKDGKLDTFETAFRDAYLDEMSQEAEERGSAQPKSNIVDSDNISMNNTGEKKADEKNVSAEAQLFVIILVIVVLVGGFILALSVQSTMFIRAVIIFIAAGISISLLKSVGLYK